MSSEKLGRLRAASGGHIDYNLKRISQITRNINKVSVVYSLLRDWRDWREERAFGNSTQHPTLTRFTSSKTCPYVLVSNLTAHYPKHILFFFCPQNKVISRICVINVPLKNERRFLRQVKAIHWEMKGDSSAK